MTASPTADVIQQRLLTIWSELPVQVRLIGVTKKQPISVIRAAYDAGLRDFGESQVQEAIAKQAALTDLPDITWHLIGHLQTNKARKALQHFDWIHSLDSLKLALRLQEIATAIGRSPTCCLQVKLVPDPPKYGLTLEELWAALPQLNTLTRLSIVGLMTIPPQDSSMSEIEHIFRSAQELQAKINCQGFDRIQIRELSMGMSSDYRAAIAAGATIIRLGTTLFGDRPA